MLWKTVSLNARERFLVIRGGDERGTLISSESEGLESGGATKENGVSAGISGIPLKGVEVAAAVSSMISIAVSRRGAPRPVGIAGTSFPGLILNKLEGSRNSPSLRGGEKTSIALRRGARARRSANVIPDGGSEGVPEVSEDMTLEASREKKRTFWPVPGVFGSRRIDLTLLYLPSVPGVMGAISRDGRDCSWRGLNVSELGRASEDLRERESCEAVQLIVKVRNDKVHRWMRNTHEWT